MGADPRRVVIACGGTGGHFYPGYVLGSALRERGFETLFLLRREDPAAKVLEQEGLPYCEVDLIGLPRSPSVRWLTFGFKLLKGLRLVWSILRSFRPAAVVGMGGYLTAPAAWAAAARGIPILLHDSNAVIGLANRLAVPFAARVALGLPPTPPARGVEGEGKYVLTGTPVRPAFWIKGDPVLARRKLGLDPARRCLLIFGGSQGAKPLNRIAQAVLIRLAARHPGRLEVLHLAGPDREEEVRSGYAGSPVPARVLGFLPDIHLAYLACDLILSRAGASTVAELAALRVPALLVPYPHSANRHQTRNAEVLADAGAALLFDESRLEADPASLEGALEDLLLLSFPEKLKAMSSAYDRIPLPSPRQSLERLVRLVEEAASA